MDDSSRSQRTRAGLEEEVVALRRRVAELEREQEIAARVVRGDPGHSEAPLVEQVPAAIWITDADLRLEWWTGGAVNSIVEVPSDWIGTDLYAFFGTNDPAHPAIRAHRAALEGRPSGYEGERKGVHFTAHVSPQREASGAVAGVIGVAIDITDRVLAEQKLRRALDRVNALTGLIPICMHCKNVRNDGGYWEQVETWVRQHSLAEFTHAICPDCMKRRLEREQPAR
ncbi:MAG: PAS domain-containing protein [Myxococcota bacterium]